MGVAQDVVQAAVVFVDVALPVIVLLDVIVGLEDVTLGLDAVILVLPEEADEL